MVAQADTDCSTFCFPAFLSSWLYSLMFSIFSSLARSVCCVENLGPNLLLQFPPTMERNLPLWEEIGPNTCRCLQDYQARDRSVRKCNTVCCSALSITPEHTSTCERCYSDIDMDFISESVKHPVWASNPGLWHLSQVLTHAACHKSPVFTPVETDSIREKVDRGPCQGWWPPWHGVSGCLWKNVYSMVCSGSVW